jgi:hypothetical protein
LVATRRWLLQLVWWEMTKLKSYLRNFTQSNSLSVLCAEIKPQLCGDYIGQYQIDSLGRGVDDSSIGRIDAREDGFMGRRTWSNHQAITPTNKLGRVRIAGRATVLDAC